jgi:protein gp37
MASKIEWTEDTWNPLIGCYKVSAGCKNCYAIQTAWIRMHNHAMKEKYAGTVEKTAAGKLNWTGKVNMHEPSLFKPLKAKKPTVYFVNSMSDLFHESVPFEFVRTIFGIMSVCKDHTFQILTKRPERMVAFFKWLNESDLDMIDDPANYAYDLCIQYGIETGCGSAFETESWPLKNVWLGVSVEDQKAANERIPYLLQVPAAVRFLSCEPLLGPVKLNHIDSDAAGHPEYCQINCLTGWHTDMARPCTDVPTIHWVIVGGESGPYSRPMNPEWAKSIRDQCEAAKVPFFFKQWGNWKYSGGNSRKENIGDWKGEKRDTIGMDAGANDGVHVMVNVGKKKAGRELEGKIHNGYPSF